MNKYTFIIVETLHKEIEIEAENEKEAFEKGKTNYLLCKDEFVLTGDDFIGAEFFIREK